MIRIEQAATDPAEFALTLSRHLSSQELHNLSTCLSRVSDREGEISTADLRAHMLNAKSKGEIAAEQEQAKRYITTGRY